MSAIVFIVGGYALAFEGLEPGVPLVVVTRCRRCGRELTRRSYPEAAGGLEALLASAEGHAMLDALRGLAHECGDRN